MAGFRCSKVCPGCEADTAETATVWIVRYLSGQYHAGSSNFRWPTMRV